MTQNRIGLKNELLYWARRAYHAPGVKLAAVVVVLLCGACLLFVVTQKRKA